MPDKHQARTECDTHLPAPSPGGRVRRGAVAALVALAAALLALPAQAQTTCVVPDFGDRREHWSGTVMVAPVTSGSDTLGHGFRASSSQGELAPTEFAIGQNTYTVDAALVYSFDPLTGDLEFSLTDTEDLLTTAERAALRLHVCDTAYDFSAATHNSLASSYTWAGSLDWSSETTRTLYLSLPANNKAMSAPVISGMAAGGQELAVDLTGIADTDGLPSSFTYQWVRVDADGISNEKDISGANAATYTLAATEWGKRVKVKVSFTDDLSGEETLTSEAYPASTTVVAAVATVKYVEVSSEPRSMATGSATRDTYGLGETIVVTVIASEPVIVEGDPGFRFSLTNPGEADNIQQATYDGTRSRGRTIAFVYTVQADDRDTDGIRIDDHTQTFLLDENDRIRMTSHNIDIDLTYDRTYLTVGTLSDHKVDGSLIPEVTVPPHPTRPTLASATTETLTIEWTHPGDGGSSLVRNVVHYRMLYTIDLMWTNVDVGTTPVTHAVITNLQANTSYEVQVQVTNASGASLWVDGISVFKTRTTTAPPRRPPPPPPPPPSPPPGDVVGYLENPGPHSFQSGIGVISGWVCEAEEIVIELTSEAGEVGRFAAGYGTERRDTQGACGDTDNGFGLLFNWNLLGDGTHSVVALVDGMEWSRTTVTVTTLGEEFVRGAEGECLAPDFPLAGETALLTWQQNSQNFVIAEGTAPAGTTNRAGLIDIGYLENPGPNSFQSGIGVLSGWVCEGAEVIIELNGEPQPAAYGTERLDTLAACGDTANGFGLLFNWNLLGEGAHEVVAFVDDVELGRATVRVTTVGEGIEAEFLRGAEGECVVEDFPMLGETVTLEWQKNSQNFVITDVE